MKSTKSEAKRRRFFFHLRKGIFSGMLLFSITLLSAQNDVIEPMSSGSVGSLFSEDKVKNIRILSSSEEFLHIEVRYEGYNEAGKKYLLKGAILDSRKQVIGSITADPTELSTNAQAADLGFRISSGQQGEQPYINSGFITVSIQKTSSEQSDEGDIFDDLSTLFGGGSESSGIDGLAGDKFTFAYAKTWRVAGNENMVINISLTPIGKAVTANQ